MLSSEDAESMSKFYVSAGSARCIGCIKICILIFKGFLNPSLRLRLGLPSVMKSKTARCSLRQCCDVHRGGVGPVSVN